LIARYRRLAFLYEKLSKVRGSGVHLKELALGLAVENVELDLVQQRQQAHDLIDALPEEKLDAVRHLLEFLVEPLSRSLAAAPVEEEDLAPETAAALDRSRASLARGEGVSHQEVLREFGA
jgi:hypothetical protein